MAQIERTCTYCHDELDEEQAESPLRDEAGDIMCDDCWSQEYEDQCERCGNTVEKTELAANTGEIIVIWEDAPAIGCDGNLPPGYYRVLDWPFLLSGMICADFFANSLRKVLDLDETALAQVGETDAMSAPLCEDCRRHIETAIWRQAWQR